jgi:hypothetical protein
MFKVGAAVIAAAAGVVLAITSVAAHSSQAAPAAGKSVAGNMIEAARIAAFPLVKSDPAASMLTIEQIQDEEAAEAAAEAAALLAQQQKEAAEAALKAQQEAAEAAAEAAEDAAEEAEEDPDETGDNTGDHEHHHDGSAVKSTKKD